jgi:hypothetical protein
MEWCPFSRWNLGWVDYDREFFETILGLWKPWIPEFFLLFFLELFRAFFLGWIQKFLTNWPTKDAYFEAQKIRLNLWISIFKKSECSGFPTSNSSNSICKFLRIHHQLNHTIMPYFQYIKKLSENRYSQALRRLSALQPYKSSSH